MERIRASVAKNEYGIFRLSRHRWTVVKRRVHLGGEFVGADLEGPRYMEDWLEYEVVEGCEGLDRGAALRKLYALTPPTRLVAIDVKEIPMTPSPTEPSPLPQLQ